MTTEIKAQDIPLNKHSNPDDPPQEAKEMLHGRDPRKAFFAVMCVGNLDGSLCEDSYERRFDVEDLDKGIAAIKSAEAEAIKYAKYINDESPTLQMYIYKCIPVAYVHKGKPVLQRIKKPKE